MKSRSFITKEEAVKKYGYFHLRLTVDRYNDHWLALKNTPACLSFQRGRGTHVMIINPFLNGIWEQLKGRIDERAIIPKRGL